MDRVDTEDSHLAFCRRCLSAIFQACCCYTFLPGYRSLLCFLPTPARRYPSTWLLLQCQAQPHSKPRSHEMTNMTIPSVARSFQTQIRTCWILLIMSLFLIRPAPPLLLQVTIMAPNQIVKSFKGKGTYQSYSNDAS